MRCVAAVARALRAAVDWLDARVATPSARRREEREDRLCLICQQRERCRSVLVCPECLDEELHA